MRLFGGAAQPPPLHFYYIRQTTNLRGRKMTQKEQTPVDGSVTFSILENRPISFIEQLRRARAEANGGKRDNYDLPFLEQLRRKRAETRANEMADPWRLRLEGVRGKVGDDDI